MPDLRKWRARSVAQSFVHAGHGIWLVLRHERNFQIHSVAVVVVVALAWWLQCTPVEWAILLLTMGFVMVTELVNTALEYVIDLLHPEYHPMAGAVKDIAAGAVLWAALVAVGVAFWILGVPLWAWIQQQ